MSKRTRESKRSFKLANDLPVKSKSWKSNPSPLVLMPTQSRAGVHYTKLVDTSKSTREPELRSDILAYLQQLFGGLF